MTAVRSVLVIGGGLAGAAVSTLLAERRCRGGPRRGQARRVGARLRHHVAGQRACASSANSASGTKSRRRATASTASACGHRTLPARSSSRCRTIRTGGPDLPATVGMSGPSWPASLSTGREEVGADVRLGTTVDRLGRTTTGSTSTFADGTAGRYDLVIGADGIRSWTRRQLGYRPGDQGDRHGHLAGVRAAAGRA